MIKGTITTADFFAGIGGIRIGFGRAGAKTVWANDNDRFCAETYRKNFGDDEFVLDDIRKIPASKIPEFDILCAGFPCPTFSLAGVSKLKSLNRPHGLEDKTRGTLFWEIVRVLKEKKPEAFFLENVKHLKNHDGGRTFRIIRGAIEEAGYSFHYDVINAKRLVPQNRTRIYVVGFKDRNLKFTFPKIPDENPELKKILEEKVPEKYYISQRYLNWLKKHRKKHQEKGHGFGYEVLDPEGVANTLMVGGMGRERNLVEDEIPPNAYSGGGDLSKPNKEGLRTLTPREFARLQGFDDSFEIPVSDTQAYKQFGNSVPVPVIEFLAREVMKTLMERPEI